MQRRTFLTGSVASSIAAVSHPGTAAALEAASEVTQNRWSPAQGPVAGEPTRFVRAHFDRTYGFNPQQTALLVIDLQKYFFGAGGLYHQNLAPIVPKVQQLIEYARSLGVQVVHTREAYAPDMSDVSPYRRSLNYIGKPGPLGLSLIRGEPGHDFIDEAKPLPGDWVFDKAAFSAFYNTAFDYQLRQAGISHLILCGVTTQCCVQSTLRDAVERGYWCLTASDCCADYNRKGHYAALSLISRSDHLFGSTADLDNILSTSLETTAN